MRVWLARVPATAMRAELPYISHYMNEVAALSWRFEVPWVGHRKGERRWDVLLCGFRHAPLQPQHTPDVDKRIGQTGDGRIVMKWGRG